MFRKLSIRMRRRKEICVNGGMTMTLSYIKSWKIEMEIEMEIEMCYLGKALPTRTSKKSSSPWQLAMFTLPPPHQ
uniref:Uncharacterized protein n=1 Tax=Picea glauca TaxID=3330 RepID=A0A101LVM3_PICGL|nr:hypothetical protein ABT39_MTgene1985 [Picea glauca]